MSTPNLAPVRRGPYRKPRADLYTVLLLLALAAVILGCVCLWAETKDYGNPPYQGAPQARWEGGSAPAVASRRPLALDTDWLEIPRPGPIG